MKRMPSIWEADEDRCFVPNFDLQTYVDTMITLEEPLLCAAENRSSAAYLQTFMDEYGSFQLVHNPSFDLFPTLCPENHVRPFTRMFQPAFQTCFPRFAISVSEEQWTTVL